jgi:hypothetical protein
MKIFKVLLLLYLLKQIDGILGDLNLEYFVFKFSHKKNDRHWLAVADDH